MKQYQDNCAEIENSLPLYVGGDLEEPASDAVARHLADCSACSEREREARSARDLLVSALALSERKGPLLWPGVRAGLVREGVLQPQVERASTRGPRRLRLLPYAAAAAALVIGFWLVRDAFDTQAPIGPDDDRPAIPHLVENVVLPAPHVTPVTPVVLNSDALRLVGRDEPRLREGAEMYSELSLDQGLGTNDEHWITTKPARRP